jgi:predicted AlkP superfamily phosphohydrolase/phosphomutase
MGERSSQRVRLVVVDGADWRLIHPLIEAGRMPHLAGLIERGVSGELGVTHPSKSPHMWTALSTGLDDDVNGLCEFFAYRPPGTRALITRYPGLGESARLFFREAILRLHRWGLGSVHYASSAQKCVPEIWDYLGDAGKTVAVVGWRFTAPPEPVRGFLLTDRFGTGEAPEDTLYPVELAHLAAPPPPAQVETQLASFGGVEAALRETLERDLLYVRTSRKLLAELEPDFLAVAHRTVDRLEHRYMLKYTLAARPAGEPLPPHLAALLSEESIQRGGQVVPQAYALFDQDLGRLLEDLGDDVVIVVSDHGHDLDGSGHQLGPKGIIVMAGGPIARGVELDSATVFDLLPTVLHLMGLAVPQGLAGRVLEEALVADWSRANPVAFLAPGAARQQAQALPEAGIGQDDARELRELGYVE